MKKKFAVIGGGMMGLILAHRLSKKGFDVTIFESASEIGGLASAWKLNDIYWDRFYHVILSSDSYLISLLAELGLSEEIIWGETKTGFFIGGKLYSVSNTIEFLKFPGLSLADKIRLGFTILYASKIHNWKRLEKIKVEDWLIRISGRKTFKNLWLPLLRAKLGENYTKTSAAFIWATIQRMYKARKSSLKKELFGYVKGGYKVILQNLVNKLQDEKVKIKTSIVINKIETYPNALVKIYRNDGDEIFDKIFLTIPSPAIANMCPSLSKIEKNKLSNVHYLGIICVSVLLKKSLSEFYVTNITDDWIPFTGVIEMTALVDKKYFDKNALVYLPKYLSKDNEKFNLSDEKICKEFIDSLKIIYTGLSNHDIIKTQVARSQNVFALPTINYSDNLVGVNTTVPNIHIINSSMIVNGTLNVNEVIRVAEESILHVEGL